MQLIGILSLLIGSKIKTAHTRQFPAILWQNLTSAYFMLDRFDTIRLTYGHVVFIDLARTWHKIPICLLLVKTFAPIEKSTQQTAQLLATNMLLRRWLQTKQYTYYFSESLTWNLLHIVQSRNDYIFSVFVLKSTRQELFCKPFSFCLIQEAENKMTNTNLMRNVFPPKSLFCYEAQEGLGEEVDVCPFTFVPKVPSYIFSSGNR